MSSVLDQIDALFERDPLALDRSLRKKPGRNQACWCGSGKKYGQCHAQADENPFDLPKLSELLLHVAAPYMADCHTLEEANALVELAGKLWNAARLSDPGARAGALVELYERLDEAGEDVTWTQLGVMLDIARAWPNDPRFVARSAVVHDPKLGWRVVVAGTSGDALPVATEAGSPSARPRASRRRSRS